MCRYQEDYLVQQQAITKLPRSHNENLDSCCTIFCIGVNFQTFLACVILIVYFLCILDDGKSSFIFVKLVCIYVSKRIILRDNKLSLSIGYWRHNLSSCCKLSKYCMYQEAHITISRNASEIFFEYPQHYLCPLPTWL